MNDKNNALRAGDVILLEDESENEKHLINDSLMLLNYYKTPKPIKFSYIPPKSQLIDSMSVKENILLESIGNSLSKSKEFQLKEFLQKSGNIHLVRLYNRVADKLDDSTDQMTNEEIKITSILKGLIQEHKILILDQPELDLSQETINLLIKTIQFSIKSNKIMTIIKTKKPESWYSILTKIVTKKDLSFKVTPIIGKELQHFSDEDAIDNGQLTFKNLPGQIKKDAA